MAGDWDPTGAPCRCREIGAGSEGFPAYLPGKPEIICFFVEGPEEGSV